MSRPASLAGMATLALVVVTACLRIPDPEASPTGPAPPPPASLTYKDPERPLEERVESLIGNLTLAEKASRGSVSSNTTPGTKRCTALPGATG